MSSSEQTPVVAACRMRDIDSGLNPGVAAACERGIVMFQKETDMTGWRPLAMSIAWLVLSAPLVDAQDLSRYRDLRFDMTLTAVAQQVGVKPSEARTIHQRPALIQELAWQPQFMTGASAQTDPVRTITCSFYNGRLFRIVVTYDRDKIEGLTEQDIVDAMSASYGLATLSATQINLSPAPAQNYLASDSPASTRNERVAALWEDSQYSMSLVHSAYPPSFGLVLFSKQMNALALVATVEATRLDTQEAPQREVDRLKVQAEATRVKTEKARLVNKAAFRF